QRRAGLWRGVVGEHGRVLARACDTNPTSPCLAGLTFQHNRQTRRGLGELQSHLRIRLAGELHCWSIRLGDGWRTYSDCNRGRGIAAVAGFVERYQSIPIALACGHVEVLELAGRSR